MSQSAEPSGVDLARVALRAAREAAKKTGARTAKNKPRLTRTVRRDGRAPMGLGEAFTALMAERGWETPTAGAGLCERWAVLAPDLAEHVAAVGYDAERGELTLRPDSTAWATKARLEASRIITDANRSARTDAVCTVRVLSPGPLPAPIAAAEPVPGSAPVVQGPVRTRETATALLPPCTRGPPAGPHPATAGPGHRGCRRAAEPGPSGGKPSRVPGARGGARRSASACRRCTCPAAP